MVGLKRRLAARASVLVAGAATALVLAAPSADAAVHPDPNPNLPGGLEGKLNTLLGVVMALAIFACVLGVFVVAILLAVAARRGTFDDHFGKLGAVGIACVLIGGASSFVMFLT